MILKALSALLALFSTMSLSNPQDGPTHALIWSPKLLAAALAPLLAMLNIVAILLGLRRRDILTTLAGVWGASAAITHIRKVTVSQEVAFAEAFGADWHSRIPAGMADRLPKRRWQIVGQQPRPGPIQRDVEFGISEVTGQPLLADILQPPVGAPRSGLALIYIHGGAWRYGRRNINKFPYFRRLANQGHLIMDIDYSLTDQTSIQEMVTDAKRAILWLKKHADEYSIDPDRIVLAGQSAGAHLALLAAYTPNHPAFQPAELQGDTSVRAVVSYYGPSDMRMLRNDVFKRFGHIIDNRFTSEIRNEMQKYHLQGTSLANGISGLMGGKPDEVPEIYDLLSPITHAGPDSPPTLLLHGSDDFLVDPRQSLLLHQKLQEMGAISIFLLYDGCDHSFESVLPRLSPSAQAAAYDMERFLALVM